MRKRTDGKGRNKFSEEVKKAFLDELKRTRDKKVAAASVGMDLVQIRSWRHNDAKFNADYKKLVVGKAESHTKEDKKAEVLRFLSMGCSQRMACDQAFVAPLTMRTWKKTDPEFKEEANRIRASFGAMKRGGFDPTEGKDEDDYDY